MLLLAGTKFVFKDCTSEETVTIWIQNWRIMSTTYWVDCQNLYNQLLYLVEVKTSHLLFEYSHSQSSFFTVCIGHQLHCFSTTIKRKTNLALKQCKRMTHLISIDVVLFFLNIDLHLWITDNQRFWLHLHLTTVRAWVAVMLDGFLGVIGTDRSHVVSACKHRWICHWIHNLSPPLVTDQHAIIRLIWLGLLH